MWLKRYSIAAWIDKTTCSGRMLKKAPHCVLGLQNSST
jgi:hypothetical protein